VEQRYLLRQGIREIQDQGYHSIPVSLVVFSLKPKVPLELSELTAASGENPGVTSIINVSSEPQQPMPRHILLNSMPAVSISQIDHDYLRRKGSLTLLDDSSRKEILRAYFHHVHAILPILDLSKLPELENITGSPSSSMLLFWAMAVAAVNVGPSDI
jgi:hypothetical protein